MSTESNTEAEGVTPPAGGKTKPTRASTKKWGQEVLDLGFCILPSLIFRAQRKLGLDPTQLAVLLQLAEAFAGLSPAVTDVVMIGFHVLLAFELPALRLRKLARKGYSEAGVVTGRDRDEAEIRFFSGWSGPRVAAALPPIRPTGPVATGFAGGQPGVIGAFTGV